MSRPIDTTMILNADAAHLPLADASVDLTMCSPPYSDARLYGRTDISRGCAAWVEWMLEVVTELARVTRGLVLINCAGVTRDRVYQPGPEGLAWEWYKRGGNLWRPAYWNRIGIPGSGGKQWLRADVEYVLCFKRDAEWLPWSDNTANGHPPKWSPGGEMSHRLTDGMKVNQWGKNGSRKGMGARKADGSFAGCDRPSHVLVDPKPMYRRGQDGARQNAEFTKLHTKSLPDGTDETQCYVPPILANPGNVVKIKVGGGLLGHPLSHENEAPFPVDLAAWFIRGWCPKGGIVLDPFGGSGSTADAAWREGRRAISCDIRFNQCELQRRRLSSPMMKSSKPKKASKEESLFPSTT